MPEITSLRMLCYTSYCGFNDIRSTPPSTLADGGDSDTVGIVLKPYSYVPCCSS